jgi:tyrosyl-tRNA synthetase
VVLEFVPAGRNYKNSRVKLFKGVFMNKAEKRELVTRNMTEILVDDELDKLLDKKNPVVYCGYETSGPVHLGHWFSIRKLIDFQKAGFKVKVLLADYHTFLNLKGEMDWIQDVCKYWKAVFVACGLDPKKTEFVLGSSFQTKKEYFDDIVKLSQKVTINRAVRSMTEVARGSNVSTVSQIIYPLMQMLDIKYLGLDAAMGATDQRKIHALAREHLEKSGWKKPVCFHHELVVSLQGPKCKMSSSKPETMVFLHDSEENIRKRLGKAFCPKEKEGNPIYQIAKFHVFPGLGKLEIKRPEKFGGDLVFESWEEFDSKFETIHPQDLKNGVTEAVVAMLKPVREYFKKNPKYLKPLEKKT